MAPTDRPAVHRPLVYRTARVGARLILGGARRLWWRALDSARVVRNVCHRVLNRSDYRRWSDLASYEVWWDERTEKIARLIPPGSRVIEFGAGRRRLEKFLDPTCTYIPSDLLDRGPGTLVCDLNVRPLPDLGGLSIDTAVFGGVLEYLHDVDSLVEWLARHVSLCVVSYACVPAREGAFRGLRGRCSRSYYGYMSGYTEDEIVEVFRGAGFRCIARDPWRQQRVFLFVRGGFGN